MAISESSVGRYICRASVYGFTEINAAASVLMRGPPRFIRKQPVQYGAIEETVKIVCEAFAIPVPEKIIWNRHDYPLPTASNVHYFQKDEKREDGMKSTLTIRNTSRTDFGEYICTVSNSHGSDEFIVKLEIQKSSFLIVILSAVIGGIIITMFAIVLMVMCRRSSFGPSAAARTVSDKTSSCAGYATSILTTSGSSSCTSSSKPTTTILSNGTSSLCLTSDVVTSSCPPVSMSSKAGEWNGTEVSEPNLETTDLLGSSDMATTAPRIVTGYSSNPYDNGYAVDGYMQQAVDGEPYNGGFGVPPPPNAMQQVGLNVMDPRYAAKYGNPYLVQTAAPAYPTSPRMNVNNNHHGSSPSNNGAGSGRPYATLNTRGTGITYSPVHHGANVSGAAPKKHVNYAGTMVGNGSLGRNPKASQQQSQPPVSKNNSSKYIMSPESAAEQSSALATHV